MSNQRHGKETDEDRGRQRAVRSDSGSQEPHLHADLQDGWERVDLSDCFPTVMGYAPAVGQRTNSSVPNIQPQIRHPTSTFVNAGVGNRLSQPSGPGSQKPTTPKFQSTSSVHSSPAIVQPHNHPPVDNNWHHAEYNLPDVYGQQVLSHGPLQLLGHILMPEPYPPVTYPPAIISQTGNAPRSANAFPRPYGPLMSNAIGQSRQVHGQVSGAQRREAKPTFVHPMLSAGRPGTDSTLRHAIQGNSPRAIYVQQQQQPAHTGQHMHYAGTGSGRRSFTPCSMCDKLLRRATEPTVLSERDQSYEIISAQHRATQTVNSQNDLLQGWLPNQIPGNDTIGPKVLSKKEQSYETISVQHKATQTVHSLNDLLEGRLPSQVSGYGADIQRPPVPEPQILQQNAKYLTNTTAQQHVARPVHDTAYRQQANYTTGRNVVHQEAGQEKAMLMARSSNKKSAGERTLRFVNVGRRDPEYQAKLEENHSTPVSTLPRGSQNSLRSREKSEGTCTTLPHSPKPVPQQHQTPAAQKQSEIHSSDYFGSPVHAIKTQVTIHQGTEFQHSPISITFLPQQLSPDTIIIEQETAMKSTSSETVSKTTFSITSKPVFDIGRNENYSSQNIPGHNSLTDAEKVVYPTILKKKDENGVATEGTDVFDTNSCDIMTTSCIHHAREDEKGLQNHNSDIQSHNDHKKKYSSDGSTAEIKEHSDVNREKQSAPAEDNSVTPAAVSKNLLEGHCSGICRFISESKEDYPSSTLSDITSKKGHSKRCETICKECIDVVPTSRELDRDEHNGKSAVLPKYQIYTDKAETQSVEKRRINEKLAVLLELIRKYSSKCDEMDYRMDFSALLAREGQNERGNNAVRDGPSVEAIPEQQLAREELRINCPPSAPVVDEECCSTDEQDLSGDSDSDSSTDEDFINAHCIEHCAKIVSKCNKLIQILRKNQNTLLKERSPTFDGPETEKHNADNDSNCDDTDVESDSESHPTEAENDSWSEIVPHYTQDTKEVRFHSAFTTNNAASLEEDDSSSAHRNEIQPEDNEDKTSSEGGGDNCGKQSKE